MHMEDSIELMPVILEYFRIERSDKNRILEVSKEAEEVIDELQKYIDLEPEKEGLISYYIHEIRTSKRLISHV